MDDKTQYAGFNTQQNQRNRQAVMGCAEIKRAHLLALGEQETELTPAQAGDIIDNYCSVASGFARKAADMFPEQINAETLRFLQARIDANIKNLAK